MTRKKRSRLTYKQKASKQTSVQKKIPVWAWFGGAAILAILFVGGLFYLGVQETSVVESAIQGLQIFPNPGNDHQEGDIAHADDVPVGGTHNPVWQNCGIYDEPVQVETVLHSLEHGAVWIAYQPELPVEQVETLRNLVRGERFRAGSPLIVLAPKADLAVPIVATAWQVQLELEDASDERLETFVQRYQRGPFAPEPHAACTGGVGEPL